LDLVIYRGDFWGVTFDEPTLGAFAPGDTFKAQVREDEDDGTVIVEFLFDTSLLGIGKLSMYYVATSLLDFSKAVWDLQRTRSGSLITIWKGRASLSKDVSKP
jgi:hypothetical protein